MTQRQRVVVIGGGYAGTMAANRLAQVGDFDVVVVNERDRFVERIRLHQWAAGSGEAAHDFATILAPGVRLVVDTATAIDAPQRQVHLASGEVLRYDYLVYALGSGAPDATIPGAVEYGHRLEDWESASGLREVLGVGPQSVAVVGGGLTGIETSAELAEQGHRVTLVTGGELGPSLSEKGRESTRETLRRIGVEVREQAGVAEIGPTSVHLDDGSEIAATVTVVTAGFAYPDLARRSGLAVDDAGRLRTDGALVSIDDARIVGTGDSATVAGVAIRNSCQAAIPLGAHAAATVRALAAGNPPKAVHLTFVGQCVSLGRHAATVQLSKFDDTPINRILTGGLGAKIKETICRSTVWGVRHPRLYRASTGAAPAGVVADAPARVAV
ncbi:FAD-dependent oxidoreductase [Gordonia sp. X0973]|uniref:NAD(P)/FAD-dependent oxidoreductase n=1 Tax=Gordonia sp. X0973 TaxID=2742602 RepID=UPI000F5263BA|nr:FAD-dependent oxidoreductase [Gordonia sp. X0973]QKT08502.1 FAD-dependent oxidoreductase [Gordonia sp. X0973]